MIATVRIASVERWCEKAKDQSRLEPGTLIPIDTNSYFDYVGRHNGCGGKAWKVERAWSIQRHMDLGIAPPPEIGVCVCEHMLEMD